MEIFCLCHFHCSLALTLRYIKAALVIQKTYRMVVVRQLFLMIRQATITIQAFTRGTLARHRYRLVSIQQPLITPLKIMFFNHFYLKLLF